jgi:hypothetical protein
VCEVWSAWPCERVVIATHNLAVICYGPQRPAGLATLAPDARRQFCHPQFETVGINAPR